MASVSTVKPPAPFISKLNEIMNDEENSKHIRWSQDGDGIAIVEPDGLMSVLSKYFKQTKVCSFVRQLNIYGFVKQSDGWVFKQQDGLFRKDSPRSDLGKITRRLPVKSKREDVDEDADEGSHASKKREVVKADVKINPPAFYEDRQNVQEDTIHWLMQTVYQQRREIQDMKRQLAMLTDKVMHTRAADSTSTSPSYNSPASVEPYSTYTPPHAMQVDYYQKPLIPVTQTQFKAEPVSGNRVPEGFFDGPHGTFDLDDFEWENTF